MGLGLKVLGLSVEGFRAPVSPKSTAPKKRIQRSLFDLWTWSLVGLGGLLSALRFTGLGLRGFGFRAKSCRALEFRRFRVSGLRV